MLGISATTGVAACAGGAVLATFFGRGVEIRRTRGAFSILGSGELSGEDVVSSIMLLQERSPPKRRSSRIFKHPSYLKFQENTASYASSDALLSHRE
jgi:hypothetical protein